MKTVLREFVVLLFLVLERIILFFCRKSRNPNGVALIRLDPIGDFVLWLDAAKELQRIYPNQKITLIANAVWADLAKVFPYWDDVWGVEVPQLARVRYRWSFLRQARRVGFSVAIAPAFSRRLMHADSVIRATGARERIGSVGDLSNITARSRKFSNRWYTRLVSARAGLMMELERNAEFIRNLSGRAYQAALPRIPHSGAYKGVELGRDYFVLFPGASWSGRQWPTVKFAELARGLCREHGWVAVLCGSQADRALCDSVVRDVGPTCVNLADKTSLTELSEVIRGARLLVGNETSAVHIAAAVGTPSVCILGGGHYGRFLPYPADLPGVKPLVADHLMPCFHCNWQCTMPHADDGPVPCVEQVSVEQVFNLSSIALVSRLQINVESSHA